jgi:hypothetical protein
MKIERRKTGFALISVLALVSVLVIMLGALMGTNRTAFAMLRVSQSGDRMDRTISSVYSYCRFQLEHDYRWAKEFEGSSGDWGQLRWTELAGHGDVQTLVGYDTANSASFAVEVCNNLKNDGEVAVLKDVQEEGSRRASVPTGFCRLEIKVDGGGPLEGVEVMTRNPGLIGGVCLANACLEIDSRDLDLLTKDPIKNQARSLGVTRLTGLENFMGGSGIAAGPVLQGSLDRGETTRDNPVIWSGTPNEFRRDDSEDFQTRQPFKDSHPTLPFKDERFVDESRSLFDIPDVRLDGLLEVTTAAGNPKPVQQIDPGIYRFEQASFNGRNVRVLTRRAADPNAASDSTSGRIEQFWYMAEGQPNPDVSTVAGLIGADSSAQGVLHEDTSYVAINGGGGAVADLLNRRMVLDERYNFEVDGDFSLIGSAPVTEQNPDGDTDLRQVNPSIFFGDPERIANSGNFNVAGAANTTNTGASAEKGSLRAQGRIHIQGDVSGSTTIAAKGDVTLEIGRFFDPEGNSETNFSVFSENNVSILPPPILEDADDRVVDENGHAQDRILGYLPDGSPIYAINVAEKDLAFTGLIYAGQNVKIDLQDTRNEPGSRRNLLLEGAIVAKEGHLDILNADKLRLVYNPQFVDRLLPGVATTGQRRIEVTGWRAIKPAPFAAPLAP